MPIPRSSLMPPLHLLVAQGRRKPEPLTAGCVAEEESMWWRGAVLLRRRSRCTATATKTWQVQRHMEYGDVDATPWRLEFCARRGDEGRSWGLPASPGGLLGFARRTFLYAYTEVEESCTVLGRCFPERGRGIDENIYGLKKGTDPIPQLRRPRMHAPNQETY